MYVVFLVEFSKKAICNFPCKQQHQQEQQKYMIRASELIRKMHIENI